MKVSLRDGFEYIPEWNGNKDLPKEEQIVVGIRFQTGMDLTESIKDDGTIDKMRDWLSICEWVKNLKDGSGKDQTPEDIATRGAFAPLYLEIKRVYRQETAIDKKK